MPLIVVSGCMFSGKSSTLIRLLRQQHYAKKTVGAFKPLIDDRYHKTDLATHDGLFSTAYPIHHIQEIWNHAAGPQTNTVLGIDEAQFFGLEIVRFCEQALTKGLTLIVAGLDTDSMGRPFGPMPTLLALADDVYKLKAGCIVCGEPATRTQRLISDTNQVAVGGASEYEARCHAHWTPK